LVQRFVIEISELLNPFNFLFYFRNYFLVSYFFFFSDLGRENIEDLSTMTLDFRSRQGTWISPSSSLQELGAEMVVVEAVEEVSV
jgi:hypothetical protein